MTLTLFNLLQRRPKKIHPIWEGLLISAFIGIVGAICLILLVAMLISCV